VLGRLHLGCFLQVDGFDESGGVVRGVVITVEHPSLDLSAQVISAGHAMTVKTGEGEMYRLHLGPTGSLVASYGAIPLLPDEVPAGTRIHVQGVVRSDGVIDVFRASVTLGTDTLRGRLAGMNGDHLTIQSDERSVVARLTVSTRFEQGSHTIALRDLVTGDDITVTGYSTGEGRMLARSLLVHRKLAGLDGMIASIETDGFQFNAADGPHHAIVSNTTVYTGGTRDTVAVGLSVHVTGYLRGDGAILATRVRFAKGHTIHVVTGSAVPRLPLRSMTYHRRAQSPHAASVL
jgi:hypothetical protein